MLQKKEQKLYVMIITIGLMLAVLWASPGWPTLQSKADLPLLDPPVVAPADDNNDDNDDNNNNNNTPLLAHIELFVSPTPIGVEAAVQWQNINGAWEDVGGWSHPLENGYVRWTVEAKDFGTGPFRWVVRTGGPTGVVVGSSESFSLPAGAGETVQVYISTGL